MSEQRMDQKEEFSNNEFAKIVARRHLHNYLQHQDTGKVVKDERAIQLGKYLSATRVNASLSRAELAAKTGLSTTTILALEHGLIVSDDIASEWLEVLADALGEQVENLFSLLGRNDEAKGEDKGANDYAQFQSALAEYHSMLEELPEQINLCQVKSHAAEGSPWIFHYSGHSQPLWGTSSAKRQVMELTRLHKKPCEFPLKEYKLVVLLACSAGSGKSSVINCLLNQLSSRIEPNYRRTMSRLFLDTIPKILLNTDYHLDLEFSFTPSQMTGILKQVATNLAGVYKKQSLIKSPYDLDLGVLLVDSFEDFTEPTRLKLGTLIDDRSDLYTLGVMLYETLVGHVLTHISYMAEKEYGTNLTLRLVDRAGKQQSTDIKRLLPTLCAYTEPVTAIAITPDGQRAVSASEDKTLKYWDLANGRELGTLIGHTEPATAVAMTPDGQRAISASEDKTLKYWDLVNGKELRTLTGHTGPVTAVTMTPDGRWAVSASADKTFKHWDLENGKVLRTLTGHAGSVTAITIAPDAQRIISASLDKDPQVWDLERGMVVA